MIKSSIAKCKSKDFKKIFLIYRKVRSKRFRFFKNLEKNFFEKKQTKEINTLGENGDDENETSAITVKHSEAVKSFDVCIQ